MESSGMGAQIGGWGRMRGQRKEGRHLGRLNRCSGIHPEQDLSWRGVARP